MLHIHAPTIPVNGVHCHSTQIHAAQFFSFRARLFYWLKMKLNRDINKCCSMDTTKYLDKYQKQALIDKHESKSIDKYVVVL